MRQSVNNNINKRINVQAMCPPAWVFSIVLRLFDHYSSIQVSNYSTIQLFKAASGGAVGVGTLLFMARR